MPFSTATLQSLYRNTGQYISPTNHSLHQLEKDGWILKEDTKSAKDDARAVAATLP